MECFWTLFSEIFGIIMIGINSIAACGSGYVADSCAVDSAQCE